MSVNIKVTGGLNIEWGQIDPKVTGGLKNHFLLMFKKNIHKKYLSVEQLQKTTSEDVFERTAL